MVVIATKGNHILGGEDIDEQIVTSFVERAVEILSVQKNSKENSSGIEETIRNDRSLMTKFRHQACHVKEMMTTKSLQVC